MAFNRIDNDISGLDLLKRGIKKLNLSIESTP